MTREFTKYKSTGQNSSELSPCLSDQLVRFYVLFQPVRQLVSINLLSIQPGDKICVRHDGAVYHFMCKFVHIPHSSPLLLDLSRQVWSMYPVQECWSIYLPFSENKDFRLTSWWNSTDLHCWVDCEFPKGTEQYSEIISMVFHVE